MIIFILAAIMPLFALAKTDFDALQNGSVEFKPNVTWKGVRMGNNAFNYYGIRYGKATRFEHSVMNTDFAYLNDNNHPRQGFVCPQSPAPSYVIPECPDCPATLQLPLSSPNKLMSEDCLYLDVYVPPIKPGRTEQFPVLFWIHGGSGIMGDKDLYESTELTASIEAVIVTINYRLSVLGLLSTGDDLARGNWAYGDMKLALNWTVQNIEAFGGDPKKITIVGHSSGGVSVSLLMTDDAVRGKVQAAVVLSGSNLAMKAQTNDQAAACVRDEATYHGCTTNPLSETLKCLKKLRFEELVKPKESNTGFQFLNSSRVFVNYNYVIDDVHVHANPEEKIEKSPRLKPLEAVFTSVFLTQEMDNSFLLAIPQNMTSKMKAAIVIVGIFTHLTECPSQLEAILTPVMQFYNISDSDNEVTSRRKLNRLNNELYNDYQSTLESLAYSRRSFANDTPNYQFQISYALDPAHGGNFHGLDVLLLFGIWHDTVPPQFVNETARASIRALFREIVHNRTLDGVSFEHNGNFTFRYLNQQGELGINEKNMESFKLWDDLYRFRCQDLSTRNPTTQNQAESTLPSDTGTGSVWQPTWISTLLLLFSFYPFFF